MAQAREAWKAKQASLDPAKLVFIDETGANTKMVRLRGRCQRGARLHAKAPGGHWKTTTFTAGLRCNALVAPFVLDGPMNGDAFLVYVEQILVPTLQPGDIVVMDNLPAHKVDGVRTLICAAGPSCACCPPTRPTSIPSKWPSHNLKHTCEKPQNEPSQHSGTASHNASKKSHPKLAPTTSLRLDMLRLKRGSALVSR